MRERSSWRSTTLTISFITCSIPVALRVAVLKRLPPVANVTLGGELVELARDSRWTLASAAMSLVTFGPGSSTRYSWSLAAAQLEPRDELERPAPGLRRGTA